MLISVLKHIYHFIRLGRPLFLLGGVLFHFLGISMSLYQGATISLPALIWGQVAITSIQLMTHYSNEYFDLDIDSANPTPTFWAGGSRILVEGHLPAKVSLHTSLGFMGIALIAVLILIRIVHPNFISIILILLGLFLAWEYSAPPLRLHSRGLGEITVGIIVPVLTPLVGYSLQQGFLTHLPILSVIPLFFLQIAMAITINLPDAVGDKTTGKKTLFIRLGSSAAMNLYISLLVLVYLSFPLLLLFGIPTIVVLLSLLLLPLAIYQIFRILLGDWILRPYWDILVFRSITLLMTSALFQAIGYLSALII